MTNDAEVLQKEVALLFKWLQTSQKLGKIPDVADIDTGVVCHASRCASLFYDLRQHTNLRSTSYLG